MRYAKIYKCDISNGPGFRISLFTQGCTHYCEGCFNPETWDFACGKLWTEENVDNKILDMMSREYISGLSILGGDPFSYYEDDIYEKYITQGKNNDNLLLLLKKVKEKYPEKTIWLWTGYLWEDFFNGTDLASRIHKVLPYIDV